MGDWRFVSHYLVISIVISAMFSFRLPSFKTLKLKQSEAFPNTAARYDLCEDLAQMGELNEACVLNNLKRRYEKNLIYVSGYKLAF